MIGMPLLRPIATAQYRNEESLVYGEGGKLVEIYQMK